MKHAGKARRAGWKLIAWTLVLLIAFLVFGVGATLIGSAIVALWFGLAVCWVFFALFTLLFFRDPQANVPAGSNLIVSPAHGKVDVVGETNEPEFMGGPCQRISIFLSVFDVHVQNAPLDGQIVFFKHRHGQFLNALRTDCASVNENVLIGFEPKERPSENIGVRLVAGVIARRIEPWVAAGDAVTRGERISLIQFGSRVEVYLPLSAKIQVKLGDKVTGGETVIATFQ